MHLLFTRFPLESALGGAEIQTLSLMEGLIERGHNVSFAGSCPVLLAECRKRNIPTTELQIGKPPVTKWEAISFALRKKKMRAMLKKMLGSYEDEKLRAARKEESLEARSSKPAAIVMLSMSEKLLLTDIAADAGISVMWVEHDRVGRWLAKNPWLPLLLKQSKKAMTVTVSELSRKIYLQMGWDPKRVIAIPNGVTLRSEIGDRRSGSAELRLGCIARLSREKGVDVLINAMADVPENITLEIVGTGREEQSLKALARRLHLDGRIAFTGSEADIGAAYARWDALILPSRDNDPFGMVAAEAMLAGLPVIVTDQCGIAGYLEDGKDALIVKAGSSSALSQALAEIGDRRSEIGQAGQKTAEEKFSVERMVQEYAHLLSH